MSSLRALLFALSIVAGAMLFTVFYAWLTQAVSKSPEVQEEQNPHEVQWTQVTCPEGYNLSYECFIYGTGTIIVPRGD